jgi:transposase-like protein
MRYSASEKAEIIRLVEQSHLSAKRTLDKLGIPRATFYRWYDRYRRDRCLLLLSRACRLLWRDKTAVFSPYAGATRVQHELPTNYDLNSISVTCRY